MSMVLSRSPLEPIGMNATGAPKRRSARLSGEGAEENEPPAKKTKINGAQTSTVSTKEQDGDSGAAGKKKRKVYEENDGGFSFSKGRKSRVVKAPTVRNSAAERASPAKAASAPQPQEIAAPSQAPAPTTAVKKVRRQLPTTPESDAKPVRRSKRPSNETAPAQQASPHKPAHAKSHANHERSPSPFRARPVTVEKKRRQGENGVEEEKTLRIQLPFADTPVITRNKEMRKTSAENSRRRSSSGMRGKRASSLIDEGRGNGESSVIRVETTEMRGGTASSIAGIPAFPGISDLQRRPLKGFERPSDKFSAMLHDEDILSTRPPSTYNPAHGNEERYADERTLYSALPHSEVPAAEFFKHISADLTEPRRMRCLLGWCGTRALPPKPEAPKDSTPASTLEFQALHAARVIQEELSQDLTAKGLLSDWFSRDESAPPQVPLRKKPNPRNVANAAKAEELERELARLKQDRAEWDDLIASTAATDTSPRAVEGNLSPLRADLLDSPQRAILEQLQAPTTESSIEPAAIGQRLRHISENLEFTVDQFAHEMHSLAATRDTAERLADRTLDDAAKVLEEREKEVKMRGKVADPMDALRGLAKVLNSQHR